MTTINETLKMLPPQARKEAVDFIEFLAQKYLKKKSKRNPVKKEILSFAGSWKNMKEDDFQNLINDVYERREKSFTRRREI